ncbi:MAG: CaiB/BaiF CoA-transferase family protein [Microthrixaceae bacterium]
MGTTGDAGVLAGIKVIEIGGLGPAPFCAMMLADHGAEVLRVERLGKVHTEGAEVQDDLVGWDIMSRGRLSAGIDLKHELGRDLVRRLSLDADVFIEGFRPGVAERLGIGPDDLRRDHERLVYGRMTGWGRSGPLADRAGHDLNYISVSGALAHIGRVGQAPTPPLNLVGDFGGGGMLLAFGICAALVRRGITGIGQVVDAAMVDGAALLMAPLFGAYDSGYWSDERGTNLLDSGAPFYDCYQCADGGYVAVGALEPQFFAALVAGLDLDPTTLPSQNDRDRWPELREAFETRFRARSRDDWAEHFSTMDACVSPVLTMGEAPSYPHHVERDGYVQVGGVRQPGPAPRFSESPAPVPSPPQIAGANTDEVLARWGIDADERIRLRSAGAIG